MDPAEAAQFLFSALSPSLVAGAERLRTGERKLVHYTSAANALNIVRSGQFWLRNVRCMNDYSEVQYGINLILKVFGENDNARRERLVAALDQVAPGSARAAIALFDQWLPILPDCTFIGCLSEHDPDDMIGRLSMWRAYSSQGAGIAIVMNSDPFLAETDALKAYSLPVAYLTDVEFSAGVDASLTAIENNLGFIAALDSASVEHIVFWWFLFLAIGLKHPAFKEEQEWRIVYIPNMDKSVSIEECVEVINYLPQTVQKIPLRDDVENGLKGADLEQLVHRIIIGPSEFPLVLSQALASELKRHHVTEPEARIALSLIPLR